MNKTFEDIDEIATLASGVAGKELYFRNSEALRVVTVCTEYRIAVLGIEILELQNKMFQAKGCSDYQLVPNGWLKFVQENNAHAERFLKEHKSATDVYILSTASREEFSKLIRSS